MKKMLKLTINCVLLFVVFMSVLENGLSVRCYVCNSETQAACKDPFNKRGLETQECTYSAIEAFNKNEMAKYVKLLPPSHVPGVSIVCQKIIFESGEIARSCQVGSGGETNAMCMMFKSDGSRIKYCDNCSEDGCNGSSMLNIPAAIGLLSIAGMVVFSRL